MRKIAGDDWMRPALCEEALRLGRVLAELMPNEPEVHGLVALMEIQASRSAARSGPSGEPVLLLDQDRGRWDQLFIRRGLAALERAEALGGALGPYALQAAIAACHARARTPEETDWARIAALYEALAQLAPSPVVELNRAVALAMAFGPATGLELVDALTSEPSLKGYHLLPSVRGVGAATLSRRSKWSEEGVSLGAGHPSPWLGPAPEATPGSVRDAPASGATRCGGVPRLRHYPIERHPAGVCYSPAGVCFSLEEAACGKRHARAAESEGFARSATAQVSYDSPPVRSRSSA